MFPQPPWIADLAGQACRSIQLLDHDSPIGCHYFLSEDAHEISIFVSSTEIVGGPGDGRQIVARFIVDAIELMKIFDFVDSMTWQPQTIDEKDEIGAHFSVSGRYANQSVWLRILGNTPDQFLPGRVAIVAERKFINIWMDE